MEKLFWGKNEHLKKNKAYYIHYHEKKTSITIFIKF